MRKLLIVLTAFMFLGLMSSSVYAEMTGDEVLNKHIEKTGGMENYKKLESLKMVGKGFMGNVSFDFTLVQKTPNYFHMNMVSPMFTVETASDGKDVWSKQPMVQGYIFVEEENLPSQLERMRLNQYIDYKERGAKAELTGEEEVKGAPCYKVNYISAAGDTTELFINKDSYQLVKQVSSEGSTLYDKYQEVEGLMFPQKMTQLVQGQRITIVMNEILVNPKVDESLFVPPADSLRANPEDLERLQQMQQGGGQ